MNELKFNSQICTTREQSQRLFEMGLKPETADMHHYKWSEGYWDIQACPPRGSESCYIPAWSLHRLIEILDSPLIEFNKTFNPYEEIIDLISKCLKIKCITNKEYLKQ